MPLKLYKMDLSPPVCAALMICEVHNLPVEMIDVNLMSKDHLKPEYLKKNPMHTIPMLEDGDLIVHDSHVILTYLTDMYGKDDSLYPKDPKQRALVDQKLYFDTLLFFRLRTITYSAIFEGVRKPEEKKLQAIDEAYGFLEQFLLKNKFVSGENMTIADISIVATVSALRYIVPIDAKKYPKIQAWFSYMEKQPFYQKGAAKGSAELKEVCNKALDL